MSPEQTNQTEPALFIDGHVHIHAHTNVDALLSFAWRHFAAVAVQHGVTQWAGMLWLAEMAGQTWFESVARGGGSHRFGSWQVSAHAPNALLAQQSGEGRSLLILAGSQVVTSERLEVLALGSRTRFNDGLPLDETIEAAQDAGALVVLPWAVGKWLGDRGQLVQNALTVARERRILAGDNAGRPVFWAEPDVFETVRSRGLPVLPGTDPLPIPGEERRVGANGFWLCGRLPPAVDGTVLQEMILGAGTQGVHPFGRRETPWRFVRNQLALRIRKH